MSKLKLIPAWGWAAAILLVAALIFRFALRGYSYIAHTLTFIAALILLHHFLPRLWWRVLVVLVCIGFVYFIIVEIPIIKNARTDADAERPYLVVLGAAVHGDDASLSLVHRLRGVLDYMEQYPESIAIVSGGQGRGENMTEAKCMYDWLTAHGVDGDRLILEEQATNTAENFAYSSSLLEARGIDTAEDSVAVVTNDFHVARARLAAQKAGYGATLGIPAKLPWKHLSANYYLREAFAVLKTVIFD